MGLVNKLKAGLQKTKTSMIGSLSVFTGKKIDESTIDDFEELLYSTDLGVKATAQIMDALRYEYGDGRIKKYEDVKIFLRKEILSILGLPQPFMLYQERPFVVLCIGVNGVGKTTTIGKIAKKSIDEGYGTILAASDTFRAAAIEQLEIWSSRSLSQIVKHQAGSDPASVAFDAIEAAKSRSIDLVLIDTAGRLHTKSPLIEELKKIKRVVNKAMQGAPHETLLVVDATTGQNALHQAKMFNEAVGITGIVLTKLDGTAKGGIVVAIRHELNLPVRMIGVGEGIEDLKTFIPEEFVEALFD
ncbi:MAG: signal recognition particle-docking protein FtsY [Candidatus Magnetoovum sp. WYHC-5]|nr:signal recognition particle-docking protein FtsY [Candidatus Magnetoovum sp. WYHC-5]